MRKRNRAFSLLLCLAAPHLACSEVAPNEGAPAASIQGPLTPTPVSKYGRLKVCGAHICDQSDNPVQLRGMSYFWSNTGWGGERFYNATSVSNLANTWNATVVRAAVGVEGSGGYLESAAAAAANTARAKALVDAAIAEGIYVIVDWHYSGNAIYQSQAQAFFQNMAQTYASSPNIIWEPFNEPTSNSWSSLKAYHQVIISTIRAAGSQNLVVVGSPTWSQDVDVASADPIATDSNVAYTLHFYAGTHGQSLRDKANTAMSRGLAIFTTEWGTCDASGNANFNPTESRNWTNWMDANKISSCNWSLNDKAETASALVTGASATGPWPDGQLTQSGAWVKPYIVAGYSPDPGTTLTVTKTGTGSGSVTSNPSGVSCGSTCSASFASGTSVTLTASAASGSTFAGWGGACSGVGTCTVSMTEARSVTAAFNSTGQAYTLTVTKTGTGSGTVTSNPFGVSCGSTCSASFASGTSVTLTASASSGSTFAGWGGACSGIETCTVSMTAARSVTAAFNSTGQAYTLTVTRTGTGSGTVASNPSGVSCGSTCSASFASGTSVTLTASAANGSTFAGWSGACSGVGTCTVSMTEARSVTAAFNSTGQAYTLTVTKTGTGKGAVTSNPSGVSCGWTCSASFASGTSVTLTASASRGSTFAGWGGACSGIGTCTVSMTEARSVTATFNRGGQAYTLTVTKTGAGSGTVTSSPSGVSCGSTCSASFASGTSVTLTASASSGSTFAGWGGACSGIETCTVSMTAARSVTAAFNREGGGAGTCHVVYSLANQWPGGFQAGIAIQNTSSSAWTSWTLSFAFGGDQKITNLWNGSYTQSGSAVTVKSVGYNGSIATGATYSGLGLTGTYGSSNAAPTGFAVNGVACN